jgi:hypothetical protein
MLTFFRTNGLATLEPKTTNVLSLSDANVCNFVTPTLEHHTF